MVDGEASTPSEATPVDDEGENENGSQDRRDAVGHIETNEEDQSDDDIVQSSVEFNST